MANFEDPRKKTPSGELKGEGRKKSESGKLNKPKTPSGKLRGEMSTKEKLDAVRAERARFNENIRKTNMSGQRVKGLQERVRDWSATPDVRDWMILAASSVPVLAEMVRHASNGGSTAGLAAMAMTVPALMAYFTKKTEGRRA